MSPCHAWPNPVTSPFNKKKPYNPNKKACSMFTTCNKKKTWNASSMFRVMPTTFSLHLRKLEKCLWMYKKSRKTRIVLMNDIAAHFPVCHQNHFQALYFCFQSEVGDDNDCHKSSALILNFRKASISRVCAQCEVSHIDFQCSRTFLSLKAMFAAIFTFCEHESSSKKRIFRGRINYNFFHFKRPQRSFRSQDESFKLASSETPITDNIIVSSSDKKLFFIILGERVYWTRNLFSRDNQQHQRKWWKCSTQFYPSLYFLARDKNSK